jgi:hypothetical protein
LNSGSDHPALPGLASNTQIAYNYSAPKDAEERGPVGSRWTNGWISWRWSKRQFHAA